MSVRLYMDVHIPLAITEGLRRRGTDVLTAQQDGAEHESAARTEMSRLGSQSESASSVGPCTDDRLDRDAIAGCPSGVNYQVRLTAEAEPTDFASRLVEALGSDVTKYAAR